MSLFRALYLLDVPPKDAGSRGALPNLIVVGAMKSGTSSLHYYLSRHPEIQMSQPKELHYFIDSNEFDPEPYVLAPGETAPLRGDGNWHRGEAWYRQHFDPRMAVRGESTVAYSFPWYLGTPSRIARTIPDVRLIYIVRDPVDRMISHYLAYRQAGREHRDIEHVMAASNSQYLAASRYRTVLDGFLAKFDRSQLMIIRQDLLMTERRKTLAAVFRFLQVEPSFWTDEFTALRNTFRSKGRALRNAERFARTRVGRKLSERLPTAAKAFVERSLGRTSDRGEVPLVSGATVALIRDRLDSEVSGIEELTGWTLDSWRRDPS